MDVGLPKGPAFNNPASERLDAEVLEKEYRAGLQSLQSVDDLVEAVMDALRKADRLDNTIIVYTSDNGFLFGDHGKRAKGVSTKGRYGFRSSSEARASPRSRSESNS